MRRGVYNRDVYPTFKKCLLTEITEDDVSALCEKIKARNALATALHVRDVIKSIYEFVVPRARPEPLSRKDGVPPSRLQPVSDAGGASRNYQVQGLESFSCC
jgi:hypothetical protein